jgi:hypothetical protein
MARKGFQLSIDVPEELIEGTLLKAWKDAMKDLRAWIKNDLVQLLVYGGRGIQGIQDTPFYRFVTSADGLSQLGIESDQPPKLLKAYEKTIKVTLRSDTLFVTFGRQKDLKAATPHPATGTGNLRVESWLDWVGPRPTRVQAAFVPRAKLPKRTQKSIRISSAPGGLMLSVGSYGENKPWQFPKSFSDYEQKWLNANFDKIERVVIDQLTVFYEKRLK